MLRVGYAELYQTHLRETRRRAARMLSAVAAVLALTAGLALWAVSAERWATKERVESEALVDFLTFDLMREASDYISTQARASIKDKVREHYERWEPREPRAFYARAANLAQLGGVIADHDPRGALELELRSLALLEQLHRDAPDNENYFGLYADVLRLTGTLHEGMGEPEEAAKRFSESLNAAQAFSEAFPGSLRGREQLAASLHSLASFAVSRNMFEEASDYYSECADVWEEMSRLWPEQTRAWNYRMKLGSLFSSYGFFELMRNNYSEALDYKQTAVEIYENFHEKDPNNRMIRLLYAYELNVATFILAQLRQEETAGLLFSRGEALWRGLVAEDTLPVYVQGLADMLTHGALIRIEQGHSGQGRDAGALLNEAEELVDSALKSQPDNDAFLSLKSLIGEYRGRMPGGRQNK
jgi:tetratricopeptide (TPR) repeat protein